MRKSAWKRGKTDFFELEPCWGNRTVKTLLEENKTWRK